MLAPNLFGDKIPEKIDKSQHGQSMGLSGVKNGVYVRRKNPETWKEANKKERKGAMDVYRSLKSVNQKNE